MKRLVLLAALLALPTSALAAASAQDGQSFRGVTQIDLVGGMIRADSSAKALTMSSTGGLSVYDEDRDRDKVTLWQSVISGSSLAAAGSDSTAVGAPLDVHAYRYLKLLIKVTPATSVAIGNIQQIAVQLREQMNGAAQSDTTQTFAEYAFKLAGATASDTLRVGHIIAPAATTPGSGEFVVQFNNNRIQGATTTLTGGYPNGVAVLIDNTGGKGSRFNKLAIRIRNLGAAAIAYNVSVLGFVQ